MVSIEIDKNIRPCQQPAYPVPHAMHELTLNKLNYLEKNGIISKATPDDIITWLSPCHPVAKLDEKGILKDARVTANMKQFNKAVIKQKRHIPSIPELAYELNGMKFFSKLYLFQ